MIAVAANTRIFLCCKPTDMRKSFNGLSGLVTSGFGEDLLSGHLFVFFNRRRDYVKVLAWDHDGLAIWAKRLEKGSFEQPRADSKGNLEIDHTELAMMLQGIDFASAKRRERYKLAG